MSNKIKVLLVEDIKIAQKVAEMILTALNFEVDIAESGEQAILLFLRNKYQMVLMDLGLPGIDGFETTKRIRQIEENGGHVPIVALTAHSEDSTKQRCLSEGMDDFMTKPLNNENMQCVIKKFLTK